MNVKINVAILILIFMVGTCLAEDISYEDALAAIQGAQTDISLMVESELSVNYVNDQLKEAENLIMQLDYVSILKNSSSTYLSKAEASQALRLINYNSLRYDDVLIYTENIREAKESAFSISDEIIIFELKVRTLESDGFNPSSVKQILEQVYNSFNSERYSETREFLITGESEIEKIKSEESTANLLLNSSKSFFQTYGAWLILLLLVFIMIGLSIKSKMNKVKLRKKIKKLKNELTSLDSLLRKTQEDRFKKAIISGLVYNIRSENYKRRLENVKSEIPVLEKRLEVLINGKEKKNPTKREKIVNKETKKIRKTKHQENKSVKKAVKKNIKKRKKIVKKAVKK
ncbi:hypothetical protein HN747_01695 [archaeon]|jgi:hypothetical protein|nr:hypothetical protein [archaeon]